MEISLVGIKLKIYPFTRNPGGCQIKPEGCRLEVLIMPGGQSGFRKVKTGY
jgi:hypothetical protein